MAKLTAKAYASDSESDNEMIMSPKTSTAAAKNGTTDKGRGASAADGEDPKADGDDDDDSGEDEEEYEIEAILQAKQGAFPEGEMGYLVKWKGYDETHNSWVREEDAQGAKELISEFWKKNVKKQPRKSEPKPKATPKPRKSVSRKPESDDGGEEEEAPKKKRGRQSKASAPSEDQEEAPKKKPRKSAGAAKGTSASASAKSTSASARRTAAADDDSDEEEEEKKYVDMKKIKDAPTWDHMIECIDTVEKADDGELYVYFTLKNGGHGKEKSELCKKKMPYTLISFYEGNLRWKATSDYMEE